MLYSGGLGMEKDFDLGLWEPFPRWSYRYFVIYTDGETSPLMSRSSARMYAAMFGGKVEYKSRWSEFWARLLWRK